jgi:hypothetical protein
MSFGIVTRKATRKGIEISKTFPGFKMKWLAILAASLSRAFWEIIWNPRTAQVQRKQESLEAAEREEERKFELRREEKRKQMGKEKKHMRRVLQSEMKEDKLKFAQRVAARAKEKLRLRTLAQSKKSQARTGKTRKPKGKNAKLQNTKKRDLEEEEEIPMIGKKRKARNPPAERSQTKRPKAPSIAPKAQANSAQPCKSRRSLRIKNEEEIEIPIVVGKKRKARETKIAKEEKDLEFKVTNHPPHNDPPVTIQRQKRQRLHNMNKELNPTYPTDVP